MSPTGAVEARAALAERVAEVRDAIARACARAGRDAAEVRLVAATKTVPAGVLRLAVDLGVEDLGENYAGDLARKAAAVPATWHFIGTLQRGAASAVGRAADVLQSAVPGRALAIVGRRAAERGADMASLVEVDFTGRRTGVAPGDVRAAADAVAATPGIRLTGLMTIAPPTPGRAGARPFFERLRDLREELAPRHPDARELSMGMSADYAIAIEAGATMVRVGTALFGPRPERSRA